jgi:hypothetical protein
MAQQNKLDDHPTVVQIRQRRDRGTARPAEPLDAAWLRQVCLDIPAEDHSTTSSTPELELVCSACSYRRAW